MYYARPLSNSGHLLCPAHVAGVLGSAEALPQQPEAHIAPADIRLLVGPDFSLRCTHPGKMLGDVATVGAVVWLLHLCVARAAEMKQTGKVHEDA